MEHPELIGTAARGTSADQRGESDRDFPVKLTELFDFWDAGPAEARAPKPTGLSGDWRRRTRDDQPVQVSAAELGPRTWGSWSEVAVTRERGPVGTAPKTVGLRSLG